MNSLISIFLDEGLSSDYKIIEDENHLYFQNNDFKKVPKQGWKIHVSSTLNQFEYTFYKISKYCVDNNLNFKIIKNRNKLRYLNSKDADRSEYGKCITIYPYDTVNFKETIKNLSHLFNNITHSPYILNDMRYHNFKNLFFRYGRLRVNAEESSQEAKQLTLKDGRIVEDKRLPYFEIPETIEIPFEFMKKYSNNNHSELLNSKYKVSNLIKVNSKGGIYKIIDVKTNKNYILKEYRPNVLVVHEDDSFTVLKKELDVYNDYKEYGFIPKLIDHFQEWEHKFIVTELIEGKSLTNIIAENTNVYTSKEKFDIYIDNITEIIKRIFDIIKIFHDDDKVIGDISTENFMVDKSNNVFLIDLENIYPIYNNKSNYSGSRGFINNENKSAKEKDMVALGYLIMKLFCNSNYMVDINKKMSEKNFERLCELLNMPSYIKDTILDLINPNCHLSIDDIIDSWNRKSTFLYKIKNEIRILKFKNLVAKNVPELNSYLKSNNNKNDDLEQHLQKCFDENQFDLLNGALSITNKMIQQNYSSITIEKAIDYIISKVKKKGDSIISFDIGTNTYSPYLFDGNAGIIYILQKLRTHHIYNYIFHKNKDVYKDLIKSIKTPFANKYSLGYGIAGLCYVLLQELEYKYDFDLLTLIIQMTKSLLSVSIIQNDQALYPNRYYQNMDDSVEDGFQGLLIYYNSLYKYLIKN